MKNENVSAVDKQTNLGHLASNCISESCHTSTTEGLKTFGRIRFDYSGAMGQSRVNNDLGRGHDAYASRGLVKEVTNKKRRSVEKKEIVLGTLHQMSQKLQNSLVQTARKNAKKHGSQFNDALKR
jgi:hypothetical protein